MSPRFLQACESFQPAGKACWEILLRELPGTEHLLGPALDRAMDQVLEQLWRILRESTPENQVRAAKDVLPPVVSAADCPLRVHLPYFNAGLQALELIARELEFTHPEFRKLSEPARDQLAAAFDLLVQCQLQALCSPCEHSGACQYGDHRRLPPAPLSAAADRPLPQSRARHPAGRHRDGV